MIIHIYSIVHNEEFFLPYYLRYYEKFADKIYIFDDHSTDHTRLIAGSHPKVVLSPFPFHRGLNNNDFNECFETSYKKNSRGIADYVIIADCDEIFYNSDMPKNLENAKKEGVRMIKATGYSMVSEKLPEFDGQIFNECVYGIRERGFDKPVIFDPALDVKINPGRHSVQTSVEPRRYNITLLHYKYLSRDYYLKNTAEKYPRTEMDEKTQQYRRKRGLAVWDHRDKFNIVKVI